MYWEIEPHDDSDYDACVMPGNIEADHIAALEYATERLNAGFDALTEGQSFAVKVTLRAGDIPEDVEGRK